MDADKLIKAASEDNWEYIEAARIILFDISIEEVLEALKTKNPQPNPHREVIV